MRGRFVTITLAAVLPLAAHAQDAGRLGLLVLDADGAKVRAAARAALSDASPLMRATAARLINTRNDAALLDDIRAALAKEADANAAREERRALGETPAPEEHELALPSRMPAGLAPSLLDATKCNGGWIGTVHVTIDANGRVTEANVGNVSASRACTTALDALLRLSLVAHGAPRRVELPVVAPQKRDPCLDEQPVRTKSGGVAKSARLVKRVAPDPRLVRGVDADLEVSSRISWRGCTSDITLTKASPVAAVNTAALIAASQWEFEPATEDGQPVDRWFNETLRIRSSTRIITPQTGH